MTHVLMSTEWMDHQHNLKDNCKLVSDLLLDSLHSCHMFLDMDLYIFVANKRFENHILSLLHILDDIVGVLQCN